MEICETLLSLLTHYRYFGATIQDAERESERLRFTNAMPQSHDTYREANSGI